MRLSATLALVALLAVPAAAQTRVESEDGRVVVRIEDGEVIIEEGSGDDVRVRRFSLGDADRPHHPGRAHHPRPRAFHFSTDSLEFDFDFDGLRALDGLPELVAAEALAELEHLRDFDGVFALGDRFRPGMAFGEFAGASPEKRREVREGERALADLAHRARHAEGAERQRLERELDRALEEQFTLRQGARREALQAQRERLEAQRERLEERRRELDEAEAETAARERQRAGVVRERRQELLGRGEEGW